MSITFRERIETMKRVSERVERFFDGVTIIFAGEASIVGVIVCLVVWIGWEEVFPFGYLLALAIVIFGLGVALWRIEKWTSPFWRFEPIRRPYISLLASCMFALEAFYLLYNGCSICQYYSPFIIASLVSLILSIFDTIVIGSY